MQDSGAVRNYNGVYRKQDSSINGRSWWVARNDIPTQNSKPADESATIYFSASHSRWVLEASQRESQLTSAIRSWIPIFGEKKKENFFDTNLFYCQIFMSLDVFSRARSPLSVASEILKKDLSTADF